MRPDIVLGPPGTGKTTTLIGRVEDALSRGVSSERIGYFSFTRKAAQEATERACEKFGLTRVDFPHFSTLHSMCFRSLGLRSADVLQGKRLQEFAKHAGIRIDARWSEDGTMSGFETGDRIMFMENLSRIRGVSLEEQYAEDDDSLDWNEVKYVSDCLREFKRVHGLMDFTDMLRKFLTDGPRLRLQELMIDESQDLSHLQWLVVDKLMRGCERVVVAGDDDQAIYKWAGADVDHLIDMDGEVQVLGQSYRVPKRIQVLAQEVISHVGRRREKKWAARAGAHGVVARVGEFGEADCGSGQVLVLARNSYLLREQVEPELRAQGIVYERYGKSSVDLDLLASVSCWEKLRRGGKITIAEARGVYEWMKSVRSVRRGFKTLSGRADDEEVSLEDLRRDGGLLRDKEPWYEALDNVPVQDVEYVRAARQRGEKLRDRPRVVVSTIHGSKGGQADHVVLLKEMAWRTWSEMKESPEDEVRPWYVGVTRAREKLTIVESSTRRACPWL